MDQRDQFQDWDSAFVYFQNSLLQWEHLYISCFHHHSISCVCICICICICICMCISILVFTITSFMLFVFVFLIVLYNLYLYYLICIYHFSTINITLQNLDICICIFIYRVFTITPSLANILTSVTSYGPPSTSAPVSDVNIWTSTQFNKYVKTK